MVANKNTKSSGKKTAKKAATKRAESPKVDLDNPIDPRKSYTSEQLCHALGIERTTLWRYRRQGLKSIQKGTRFFYLGSAVQEFLFGTAVEPAKA